jgi:hypothetical protein
VRTGRMGSEATPHPCNFHSAFPSAWSASLLHTFVATMPIKLQTVLILLCLFTSTWFIPANATANQSAAVSTSELTKRSFAVGDLRISITKFKANPLFLGRGYFELKVENRSTSPATFNPQRLLIVGKDNKQINVRGRRQQGSVSPNDAGIETPLPIEILPDLYIEALYELNDKVVLPARLLYEGKELALITN